MTEFEYGEKVDILALPEDLAIQIIGRPLYESLKKYKGNIKGTMTITAVDEENKTIEISSTATKGKEDFGG